MKRNIQNIIIMLMVIVMIVMAEPRSIYAAGDTISLDAFSNVTAGNEVIISGKTSLPEVVITVKKPDGTILFLATAVQNGGSFQTTLTLPDCLATGSYLVAAGSGAVIATATLSVTAKPPIPLSTPAKPVLSGGLVTWTAVANENNGYSLQLYKDGSTVGSKVTISHGLALKYDFSAAMSLAGSYTVTVTALGSGKYCDSEASIQSESQVVVKQVIAVSGIVINKIGIALNIGASTTLIASVIPTNADNKNITWSSSAPSVASVDQKGKVVAVSAGTTTITVTAEDGGKSAACTVTVNNVSTTDTGTSGGGTSVGGSSNGNDTNGDNNEDSGQDAGSNAGQDNSVVELMVSEGDNLVPVSEEELEELLSDPKITQINFLLVLSGESTEVASRYTISPQVLQLIRASGKNVNFTVKGEDGKKLYIWYFGSKSLSDQAEQVSPLILIMDRINLKEDSELKELLGTQAGEGIVFRFAYDGMLPVGTSIRIYVGDHAGFSEGQHIYLYHYNKLTNKLETLPFSSNYTVDADGYIMIDLVHCSDYVALTKEAASKVVTSLINQIKVTPAKKTLYVGKKGKKSTRISITLPQTLELLTSLKDKTSESCIGGVTASFTSSNKKVAKVDSNGKVTAVGTGKAVITTTLKLYSGKTWTVKTTITVK